ncbi:MAG: DUF2723 domain-containing protein [Candidatus Eisenbacteria bacterium]
MDAAAVGLPLLVLYLTTLQRDVGIIDSGELAGVAARLGVAHPTGYPLYSMLGRVVAMSAPSGALFSWLSGLSAFSLALASVLFVGLIRELAGIGRNGWSRDWLPRGQWTRAQGVHRRLESRR